MLRILLWSSFYNSPALGLALETSLETVANLGAVDRWLEFIATGLCHCAILGSQTILPLPGK
jgi:hypothetical protein